jgi:hypothetical protein
VHLGQWGAHEEDGWRRTVPTGLTEIEREMGSGLDMTNRGGGGGSGRVRSFSAGLKADTPCYKWWRGPSERCVIVTGGLIEREKKLGAWATVAVSC